MRRALTICDPLTIAGIGLSVGSVAANTMAQSKVQKARDDALAAERIRQRGYDQETDALNAQSRDRYKDFAGQQDQKAQQLGDYFAGQKIEQGSANQAAAQEMAASTVPQSSSNLVVAEEGKQKQKATDYAEAQGQALGNLRAFGDLMGDIGRKQARDASEIGQINSFKRGSSAVLPYELEAANSKGSGMKLFGDLLGMAGNVTTAAGLSGAITPEMVAGWFDPNVTVSGKGVVPKNTATEGIYNKYMLY